MRRELPLRPLQIDSLVAGAVFDLGMVGLDLSPMITSQRGFGIEGIHVRNATRHEEKDDSLRLRGKMWFARGERISALRQELPNDPGKQQRTSHSRLHEPTASNKTRFH